jgi:hypothetical protein
VAEADNLEEVKEFRGQGVQHFLCNREFVIIMEPTCRYGNDVINNYEL